MEGLGARLEVSEGKRSCARTTSWHWQRERDNLSCQVWTQLCSTSTGAESSKQLVSKKTRRAWRWLPPECAFCRKRDPLLGELKRSEPAGKKRRRAEESGLEVFYHRKCAFGSDLDDRSEISLREVLKVLRTAKTSLCAHCNTAGAALPCTPADVGKSITSHVHMTLGATWRGNFVLSQAVPTGQLAAADDIALFPHHHHREGGGGGGREAPRLTPTVPNLANCPKIENKLPGRQCGRAHAGRCQSSLHESGLVSGVGEANAPVRIFMPTDPTAATRSVLHNAPEAAAPGPRAQLAAAVRRASQADPATTTISAPHAELAASSSLSERTRAPMPVVSHKKRKWGVMIDVPTAMAVEPATAATYGTSADAAATAVTAQPTEEASTTRPGPRAEPSTTAAPEQRAVPTTTPTPATRAEPSTTAAPVQRAVLTTTPTLATHAETSTTAAPVQRAVPTTTPHLRRVPTINQSHQHRAVPTTTPTPATRAEPSTTAAPVQRAVPTTTPTPATRAEPSTTAAPVQRAVLTTTPTLATRVELAAATMSISFANQATSAPHVELAASSSLSERTRAPAFVVSHKKRKCGLMAVESATAATYGTSADAAATATTAQPTEEASTTRPGPPFIPAVTTVPLAEPTSSSAPAPHDDRAANHKKERHFDPCSGDWVLVPAESSKDTSPRELGSTDRTASSQGAPPREEGSADRNDSLQWRSPRVPEAADRNGSSQWRSPRVPEAADRNGSLQAGLLCEPEYAVGTTSSQALRRVPETAEHTVGLQVAPLSALQRAKSATEASFRIPKQKHVLHRASSDAAATVAGPKNRVDLNRVGAPTVPVSMMRNRQLLTDKKQRDSSECAVSGGRHRLMDKSAQEVEATAKRVQDCKEFLTKEMLEQKNKKDETGERIQRPDRAASAQAKAQSMTCNQKPRIGDMPGIHVGDRFSCRHQMCAVGIHNHWYQGISWAAAREMVSWRYTHEEKHEEKRPPSDTKLCVAVVLSGRYQDNKDEGETVVYTGEGGHRADNATGIPARDQVLEKGNLALYNNYVHKIPVRLIRYVDGVDATDEDSPVAAKEYTYDGLYAVEGHDYIMGEAGYRVYQFTLRRLSNQRSLQSSRVRFKGVASTSRGDTAPFNLLEEDLSDEKENVKISVVNDVDDAPSPRSEFTYVTRYVDAAGNLLPPGGPLPPVEKKREALLKRARCTCVTTGCSSAEENAGQCACVRLSQLRIPRDGSQLLVPPYDIVWPPTALLPLAERLKSIKLRQELHMVHECGPLCASPATSNNRNVQHGLRYSLQVFRTKQKGWGVRTLETIPQGGFVCSYVGALLTTAEALQQTEDDYLFDLDESGKCDPQDIHFVVNARHYGSVGRFINHSCEPNMLVQNVRWNHQDPRLYTICFFASKSIYPHDELTYNYNHDIGAVINKDGTERVEKCACGSKKCVGRLL
ncbi:hypothetical protein CYMTET_10298 [Cymbomonas tetramitiformis]|uniref:Histone-lysine N-methyltransferase n=1 Tax=Cymbomonas tetramitiformis TaxID=36881 RepID=A0AAE0LDZ6_9CHLO|nr:hypothetical protein CYMTET_10298 [Cymbomonas tetramitiformis]